MNGFLEIKKDSEKFDYQLEGNHDQYKWNVFHTPCIISFFKKKLDGETTIIDFNAHKIAFEADNTMTILKSFVLSPNLFNQNGSFFAIEVGTCFLTETGLYYFDFTADSGQKYKTGLICVNSLTGIPIPDNALFDFDADEYVLSELEEYILIP